MKPGEEAPQNWQQPPQAPSQAPYQAPVAVPDQPAASTQATPPVSEQPGEPAQVAEPLPHESPMEQAPDTDYQEGANGQEEVPADDVSQPDDDASLLRWQASEHVDHDRTVIWYGVLALVVIALVVLAIFVFHSISFAVLIPVMLVALVVYVRRPPALLSYILSRKGLHINDRLYTYDQFRAFGVVTYEGMHSVVLLPRKRFQVSQTLYFPEEVGESLVDMLAARLPMQEVKLDAIDRLLKKLRIN